MLPIQGLKCVYDTGSRGWAIELVLIGAESEIAVRRFDVDGPDDAEMLISAFEESTASSFDPESGEIVFAYEYASLVDDDEDDEDEDEADEESEDSDDESEDDEDEEEAKKANA